jgi:hypothetical protein
MTPTKRQFTKNGTTKWELDYGKDALGVRRRPTFDTEQEADDAIKKHRKTEKSQDDYLARMTEVERGMLVSVLQEIKAAGHTISHVWEAFKTRKKEVDAQSTTTPRNVQKLKFIGQVASR